MNRTMHEDSADIMVVYRGLSPEPDARVAPAGTVRFVVINEADQAHDFLLIRTDEDLDDLPRNGDRIDESAVDVAGRLAAIPPGGERDGVFELEPGRHVLLCNTSGHAPASTGLELTVQPAHGEEGERL